MFTNQCSKCGEVFETKNPKRVICPNCLYPEGGITNTSQGSNAPQQPSYPYPARGYAPQGTQGNSYVPPGNSYAPPRPQQGSYAPRYPQQPGYGNHRPPQGGYMPRQQQPGGYGPPRPPGPPGRGYGPPRQQQPGGYGPPRPPGPPGRGYGPPRPPGRGYGPPRPQGGRPGFPPGRGKPSKRLLVTKEQLVEIEKLYKEKLPLPNPDIHEIIGEKIDLAPSKVFFGINLVRMAMKLPKLEYPKRKLAVTPEQLMAIETLYEPYLPLPPLGIHKIISKQLRMDEWRVHVAIGLIRKNKNLSRWNEERDDLTPEMKAAQQKNKEEQEKQRKERAAKEAEIKAKKEQKAAQASVESSESKTESPSLPKEVDSATVKPESEQEITVTADSNSEADAQKTEEPLLSAESPIKKPDNTADTLLSEPVEGSLSQDEHPSALLSEGSDSVKQEVNVSTASKTEESKPPAPKRRGRPPGSKNATATKKKP